MTAWLRSPCSLRGAIRNSPGRDWPRGPGGPTHARFDRLLRRGNLKSPRLALGTARRRPPAGDHPVLRTELRVPILPIDTAGSGGADALPDRLRATTRRVRTARRVPQARRHAREPSVAARCDRLRSDDSPGSWPRSVGGHDLTGLRRIRDRVRGLEPAAGVRFRSSVKPFRTGCRTRS